MTEEQLKTVIMNAHMAGQYNAGVDSSNYEALAYYESLVKNLTIRGVSNSLKCDCKHSGSCRYEQVILDNKEICRHKE